MVQRTHRVTEIADVSIKAAMIGSFILSLLFSGMMQLLWTIVNTLQIIMLTELFNLDIPYNAEYFMLSILKLVTLEFVPTDETFDAIFRFRDKDAFNTFVSKDGQKLSRWEESGFESAFFIPLMGAFFFVVISSWLFACSKALCVRMLRSFGDNFFTRLIRKRADYTASVIRFGFEGCI